MNKKRFSQEQRLDKSYWSTLSKLVKQSLLGYHSLFYTLLDWNAKAKIYSFLKGSMVTVQT
jgi:hypothetical protein